MSAISTDKQHYVSQFLLKRFGDRSGHTYVWDKETDAILPGIHQITEYAYSKDLYTEPADRILRDSEVKASKIIRKKIRTEGQSSWSLSVSEYNSLTRFVSLLVMRSPKVAAMMSRLKESEVERIERLPPTVLVNVRGIDILAKSARLAEIARESDPFNEVLADTTNMGDVVTSLINTMSV